MNCRNCESGLAEIFNFGEMPLANSFNYNQADREIFFEQTLMFCKNCALVQLGSQPDPKLMFHQDYPFFTGLSSNMKIHFKGIATEIKEKLLSSQEKSLLLEIGCNDGTFLSNFKEDSSIKIIGVDPSKSATDKAVEKGIDVLNSFYDTSTAKYIYDNYGKADVIYASNVICHIPNITTLAELIAKNLSDTGYFIFEEPYLGDVVRLNSFDQIYDEHVFLFSLISVERIFEPFGLRLVDASKLKTHGGSMRYYLTKNSNIDKSTRLEVLEKWEVDEKINSLQMLKSFAENLITFKNDFKKFLENEIHMRQKVLIGYPATSKSTTILNYCEINEKDIFAIFDSTLEKIGGFAPGTEIPIKDEVQIKSIFADYCFLFGWNHHEEISKKLESSEALPNTKWITHIPEFRIFEDFSSLSTHLKSII